MSKRETGSDPRAARAPGGAGASDAPGVPAASSASAQGTVSTLIEERRRYESWIAALDARRTETPPRVFTRVHADYTARLEAVVEQLATHGAQLEAELNRLTERLEAAFEQQQQARDERAESELRAHVGELSATEWEETARAADERIDALAARHADLETELLRTRELLAEAQRPATPATGAPVIVSGGAAEARAAAAEATVRASVDAAASTPTPSAVEALREAAVEATPPVEQPPGELPPAVLAAEATLFDAPASDVAPAPARPSRTASFDEMAFLNSVVDAQDGPAASPAERAARPSAPSAAAPKGAEPARPSAGRRDASAGARGADAPIQNRDATADRSILDRAPRAGTPMAANVSGNNPIVLKDKESALDGAKTLKCADCGAMNYPTEWYCERCGAELASL